MVISYRICTEIFKQLCDVVNPEGYEIMKVSIKDRYFFFGININILLRDCVDPFLYRTNFCIGPTAHLPLP